MADWWANNPKWIQANRQNFSDEEWDEYLEYKMQQDLGTGPGSYRDLTSEDDQYHRFDLDETLPDKEKRNVDSTNDVNLFRGNDQTRIKSDYRDPSDTRVMDDKYSPARAVKPEDGKQTDMMSRVLELLIQLGKK